MTESAIPRFLYHGTRAEHQHSILAHDLVPRNQSGVSQWTHTAESRPDAVYLTSAYPLHFAANAQGEGDLLIIEVDTLKLNPALLVADEDALALSLKEPATEQMTLLEKVLYYRDRGHHYKAEESLALLGTCAYIGKLPASALRRAARIRLADVGTLIVGGFDPVVAPINFSIFGDEYRESIKWLFGDTDVCAINPRMPRVSIEVTTINPP